jgi:hypothetical protein
MKKAIKTAEAAYTAGQKSSGYGGNRKETVKEFEPAEATAD